MLSVQPDGLVTIAHDGGEARRVRCSVRCGVRYGRAWRQRAEKESTAEVERPLSAAPRRHENFRLRLHSGARPAVSLEAVSPDGASRAVRLGKDGALHAVARGPPSRFALEPASGSRVLLQLVASGELLSPVVAPPSARRVPVAFLAAPGAAAAWTLTHHGDGRYTLAAAADGEPRRHLTREPSGAVVLSSDPALAFPAPASLFTLEATSDGAGGVAAWLLRPCGARGAAGVVARDDAGRAEALQRSPVPMDALRIIDVAAAAAAAAGGGAAAHAAARAAMAPDAPRAACWATAGAAAAAADAGTAAGARRPPATLRALAAAALSREAPMEAGGPPPAALSEAEQAAAFGAVYVPDYAAAAVKAAWLARQPAPGGACKVPLPPDASPFPGAMRCVCCDKTVLRMAAESNPAHHGYLAAEARRAARAAPPRNGSVPGAFWHAVGSFVCIALVAAAAGSGVRCAVHARSHRRAARAAA